MPVEGTRCVFDFARRPARVAFAHAVVDYVDRKVPELFAGLQLPVPADRLQIRFAAIGGAQYVPPNTIELGDDYQANDLGCLIHESVHWAQLPGLALYSGMFHVFEGVADHYRIVFSDDHQGDYFNDGKRYLVANFRVDDPYDSASEFVAYLRRVSGEPSLIRLLNDALRSGQAATVETFFQDRFDQSYQELLAAYPQARTAAVGLHPETVNRYGFFTGLA
jgi:hypothetical protein